MCEVLKTILEIAGSIGFIVLLEMLYIWTELKKEKS